MPRSQALIRAQSWIDARVPYSQSACHNNQYGSYRTDCSGMVSMAWGLRQSYTTSDIHLVSHTIARADLQPGDALNKPGSHMGLFVGWADAAKTRPIVREHTGPTGTPPEQNVWSVERANTFTPIRYDNIAADGGIVRHRLRTADGGWTPYGELGITSVSHTAIAAAPDLTHALVITGGQIQHRVRRPDGSWTGWAAIGTPGTATGVTAATDDGGNLQVAAIVDGQTVHRIRYTDGTWSNWGSIGLAGGTFTAIGAAIDKTRKQFHLTGVFNGQAHHRVRQVDGSWTPWALLANTGTASAITAAIDPSGNVHVAATINGQPYHRLGNPATGQWTGWGPVGEAASTFTQLAASADPKTAILHLTAIYNNQIHHRLRRTDGTWTPWAHVGNPGNANALSTTTDPSQNLHVITAS